MGGEEPVGASNTGGRVGLVSAAVSTCWSVFVDECFVA